MRLIDADDLIKQLEEGVWNSAVEEVKNQPTAYDVEAVVRELEELKKRPGKNCPLGCSSDTPCYECMVRQAIEIVRGGRNEDTDSDR